VLNGVCSCVAQRGPLKLNLAALAKVGDQEVESGLNVSAATTSPSSSVLVGRERAPLGVKIGMSVAKQGADGGTAAVELKSLAFKLGETYCTQDLTTLLQYKKRLLGPTTFSKVRACGCRHV
jgi:hypothetical protein